MMNVRRWKLWLLTAALLLSLCACGPKPPAPAPTPDPDPAPPPVEDPLPEEPPIPDPVGFLRLEYPEMPVLRSQEQVAAYMMASILRGDLDMEFYVDRELGDDWDTYFVLDNAQESTKTYNLFGAYEIEYMRTEDRGDEEGLYGRFHITYPHQDYDDEARAAAWAWVRDNPPPKGGFTDFETEKAYALAIHDYLACKVTYDPRGDDQDFMDETYDYEAFQEAYNVLGKDQHTAVCAGYSRAFALIAQYAGINAAWVRGNYEEDGGSHAWNVIYPCDGSEPVLVDVTWDDSDLLDSAGAPVFSYDYFYCPLSEDTEHRMLDHIEDFLTWLHS